MSETKSTNLLDALDPRDRARFEELAREYREGQNDPKTWLREMARIPLESLDGPPRQWLSRLFAAHVEERFNQMVKRLDECADPDDPTNPEGMELAVRWACEALLNEQLALLVLAGKVDIAVSADGRSLRFRWHRDDITKWHQAVEAVPQPTPAPEPA